MDRKLRKTPTTHQRISIDLDVYLKNFASKNELSIPDASKEIAKICKDLEEKGMKRVIRELKF